MSNTTNLKANSGVVAEIYEQIVEIKKKQLELKFTPFSHRGKDYITEIRNLRASLANLQRDIVAARENKAVVMKPEKVATAKKATKRGEK